MNNELSRGIEYILSDYGAWYLVCMIETVTFKRENTSAYDSGVFAAFVSQATKMLPINKRVNRIGNRLSTPDCAVSDCGLYYYTNNGYVQQVWIDQLIPVRHIFDGCNRQTAIYAAIDQKYQTRLEVRADKLFTSAEFNGQ